MLHVDAIQSENTFTCTAWQNASTALSASNPYIIVVWSPLCEWTYCLIWTRWSSAATTLCFIRTVPFATHTQHHFTFYDGSDGVGLRYASIHVQPTTLSSMVHIFIPFMILNARLRAPRARSNRHNSGWLVMMVVVKSEFKRVDGKLTRKRAYLSVWCYAQMHAHADLSIIIIAPQSRISRLRYNLRPNTPARYGLCSRHGPLVPGARLLVSRAHRNTWHTARSTPHALSRWRIRDTQSRINILSVRHFIRVLYISYICYIRTIAHCVQYILTGARFPIVMDFNIWIGYIALHAYNI